MVDSKKRKSLMSLSGLMVLPFVPSMASATTRSLNALNAGLNNQDSSHAILNSDETVSISLLLDGTPMMKVTNTSDELTIVRHIHPGVVSVDGKTYDLNQSLVSSAYAISPGMSRLIPIGETINTTLQPVLAEQFRTKNLRRASITCRDEDGHVLNLSSALFA